MISVEASLAAIFESVGEALLIIDTAGRPVRWNAGLTRFFGEIRSDGTWAKAPTFFAADETTPILEEDRPIMRALKGEELTGIEVAVKVDRGFLHIATSTRTLRNEAGAIVGAVAVFRDLTKELRVARERTVDLSERKRLEEHVILTDRMASIGTLAAGIAHEINNPLAYMTMNLESLAEHLRVLVAEGPGPSSKRLVEMLELTNEAQGGAERVRKIVRGMQAFSRPEISESSPQDLNDLADSAIRMVDNELRHRARIVRVFADVPLVDGDEAGLKQVLINLLANAAHAIPAGDAANNEIRLTTQTGARGEAIVEVTDTGSGIDPAILPRIFDPFFTTHALEAGAGLGLSVSHAIITLLGGTLTVKSEVGKGSAFRLTLPRSRGAPAQLSDEATDQRTIQDSRPRRRVLIVDDDEMVGRALARALKTNHDLTVLTSGKEAEDLLRHTEFDFILCDLMMPDMTGMELHTSIVKSRPELAGRFVFLTGGAFTVASREYLDAVPNACFDKPVNIRNLREFLAGPVSSH